MGNKRVSQLVELTAPEVRLDDLFLIIDTTARESKKITASELSAFLGASGSLFAIHADNADTASFILGSNVFGLVTSASYAISSSRAISAAIADLVISASYALTASFASNSGGNTSTASFLLFTGGSNGTASYAISASHANVSDLTTFLIYTGASNGTASYAVRTGNADLATNADTASFVPLAQFAVSSSFANTSNTSLITQFLQYSGTPNGTASYALVAGSTSTFMIDRGIFLADTQSANITQLDSVDISPSSVLNSTTSIEAFGTVRAKFTSSAPSSEQLQLIARNRDTGTDTILDSTPIVINISPIPSNWDNYATGTMDMPFTLAGQAGLDGNFQVFVTSSVNLSFQSSRISRFNIASFSETLNVGTAEPLQFFYLPQVSPTITFTSTDGGPFQDNLAGFNQTASFKILTVDVSSQGLTALKYVWTLNNLTQLNCSNSIFLTSLGGMPSSLTALSCSGCNISSMFSLSNTSMSVFNCASNSLSTLPNLPNTMSYLNCSNNPLSMLPILPFGLQKLYCDSLPISSIPGIFPDTITTMSFSGDTNLNIWGTALPMSLSYFNVDYTPVHALPSLPTPLLYLSASNCSLTSVAMYSICSNLVTNSLNNGQLDLLGNGIPDSNTLNAIFILIGRGWSVTFDV